jgi:hypothetical protein
MIIKKLFGGKQSITTADKFEQLKVLPNTVEGPPRKTFQAAPLKKKKEFKAPPPLKKPKKGCGCGK